MQTFHLIVHDIKNATNKLIRPTDNAIFCVTGDCTKNNRQFFNSSHSKTQFHTL